MQKKIILLILLLGVGLLACKPHEPDLNIDDDTSVDPFTYLTLVETIEVIRDDYAPLQWYWKGEPFDNDNIPTDPEFRKIADIVAIEGVPVPNDNSFYRIEKNGWSSTIKGREVTSTSGFESNFSLYNSLYSGKANESLYYRFSIRITVRDGDNLVEEFRLDEGVTVNTPNIDMSLHGYLSLSHEAWQESILPAGTYTRTEFDAKLKDFPQYRFLYIPALTYAPNTPMIYNAKTDLLTIGSYEWNLRKKSYPNLLSFPRVWLSIVGFEHSGFGSYVLANYPNNITYTYVLMAVVNDRDPQGNSLRHVVYLTSGIDRKFTRFKYLR
ncbi:hypothetical protein [Entomospira culicis]|uniref:DUF5007 domain-containing protein n=1 Tax=Entomospira culicis TaxID=2719989 RepID=A0A968KVY2_9SPIO|nr:hypothetical protein [Entomospira culicis]NIZ19457.1 hypothetical protein [Entomospira culicis]NIZ69638.1 hypothetical protein [Entomospira culicis]WDI36749.1 hypothetical protein PVA46_05345 [Entomospira culicis]WDI38378.1 hypothetical protein PVA47_05355 [Entomospira culicis]